MSNRAWRSQAELEVLVLDKLRAFRGCEGVTAVVIEAVHDPRTTATWTVSHVVGTDPAGMYDDTIAGVLPTWQDQYGLLLPSA